MRYGNKSLPYGHAGMFACIDTQVISDLAVIDHQSVSTCSKGLHPVQHNSTGRRQTVDKGPRRDGLLFEPDSSVNKTKRKEKRKQRCHVWQ